MRHRDRGAARRFLLRKGPSKGPFDLPRSSAAGRSPSALTRLPGVWARIFGLAGAATVAAGCSVTTSDEPRPGSCTPFQLVSLTPPDGSSDVRTDTTFVYGFTDFPDPDSAVNSNLGVFSGPYYYTSRESVDLIGRAIVFKPTSPLPSGLGFTLTLSAQISSLRGCPLTPSPPNLPNGKPSTSYDFAIHTAESNANLPPEPPAPTPASLAQVLAVMALHCAGGGCHLDAAGADSGGCLSSPGGGLSLCATQAYAAMVSVPSRQVTRLAIVSPRDSARSYLLRKLLTAPPVAGHEGPPDATLTEDDLRVLQSWIDDGAPAASPAASSDQEKAPQRVL